MILLDVRMPGLDGWRPPRYINARARTRHIPIIFLTAHAEDVEQVFSAYAAGAVDYVVKPFDPDVLRSKVAVFVELQRERGERVREALARAEAEAIAGTLQRHLLPDRLARGAGAARWPRATARASVARRSAATGMTRSCCRSGGIGLVIGDVVGHGVHAATLMGELRAALRAYAVAEPSSPAAVLTAAELVGRASPHGGRRWWRRCCTWWSTEDGAHVRFASAGHLPPLLMRRRRRAARLLEHHAGPPLGVVGAHRFGEWEAELRPGSTVLLYTDGLVERRDEAIDVGLARLRERSVTGPAELERLCSHVLARALGAGRAAGRRALLAVRLAARMSPRGSSSISRPSRSRCRWRGIARALAAGDGRRARRRVRAQAGGERGVRQRHRARLRPASQATASACMRRGLARTVLVEVADSGRWRAPARSPARAGPGYHRAADGRDGCRADILGHDGAHAQGTRGR